jgi:hypothetical protein
MIQKIETLTFFLYYLATIAWLILTLILIEFFRF